MNVPTTSEFVRSATSDAITSACYALIEQLDDELRGRVLTENSDAAELVLSNMITSASKELPVEELK